MKKKIKSLIIAFMLASTVVGCFLVNGPPLYRSSARAYLLDEGVNKTLIDKLTCLEPLTEEEANNLIQYDNIAVLHLVGENPGTPRSILERLSKHKNFEVQTGVASNKSAPLDLLLQLRTRNQYTTVNSVLAGNPNIPTNILMEMYNSKETELLYFVDNPNCPVELMELALKNEDDLVRTCLADNHNLPIDLFAVLKNDTDPVTRIHLATNPKIPCNILEELKKDKDEDVRDSIQNISCRNK